MASVPSSGVSASPVSFMFLNAKILSILDLIFGLIMGMKVILRQYRCQGGLDHSLASVRGSSLTGLVLLELWSCGLSQSMALHCYDSHHLLVLRYYILTNQTITLVRSAL